jgi:hypothetical protein
MHGLLNVATLRMTQAVAQAVVNEDCRSEGLEELMVKKRKRRYSPGASKDVKKEMRRFNRGTARSGPGGKGGKVKSRKQAIAIGLSLARKEGKRVPKKKAS